MKRDRDEVEQHLRAKGYEPAEYDDQQRPLRWQRVTEETV